MTDIITVDNLQKSFRARKAVDGISFSIPEGGIFGFVGPNGAGKTTTIRILTTLLRADGGTVLVDGADVAKNITAVRRKLGFVPDFFGLYEDMTAQEYLEFFAGCYAVPPADRPALIRDLLELVDLSHRRDDFVDGLSRGMKQRLGLARALIHDPKILVLDEPAAGLDPRARVEFRALLKELQRMGKTIFFSSHILADVDELCTEVGIIEAGKLVAVGNLRAMRAKIAFQRKITFVVIGPNVEKALATLSYIPEAANVETVELPDGDWEIELNFNGDKMAVNALIQKLVQADVPLLSFHEERQSLEDMFMKLTEGIVS